MEPQYLQASSPLGLVAEGSYLRTVASLTEYCCCLQRFLQFPGQALGLAVVSLATQMGKLSLGIKCYLRSESSLVQCQFRNRPSSPQAFISTGKLFTQQAFLPCDSVLAELFRVSLSIKISNLLSIKISHSPGHPTLGQEGDDFDLITGGCCKAM